MSLKMMEEMFKELKIQYVPTSANFYLLLFPSAEDAIKFNLECLNRGLILRYLDSFGIDNGIRINSGTRDETIFALDVISEAIKVINT